LVVAGCTVLAFLMEWLKDEHSTALGRIGLFALLTVPSLVIAYSIMHWR